MIPGSAEAAAVLRLAMAYQASRALHIAVRLRLPDILASGPSSVADLAAATGAHPASLRRLLRALAAFDIFAEQADGRFALTGLGNCLQGNAPGSVRDLVAMWGDADFWQTWGELEHSVCTGETASAYLFGEHDAFARYAADGRLGPVFNAGMTAMSVAVAAAVVAAYDVSRATRIVDIAGGEGGLLAELLRSSPQARGTLLDLPAVVAGAHPLLTEAGVADRCQIVGGDMFSAVPSGGDLYVLKSVIHDWDDERARAILANCRHAMAEDGRMLIIERILPDRIAPTPDAQALVLSDLNMLVRNGGHERTESEMRRLLGETGLRSTRIIGTDTPFSLVEAVPECASRVRPAGSAAVPGGSVRRGMARADVPLQSIVGWADG